MNDRAQQPTPEHGQPRARADHSRLRGRSRCGRSRPDEEVELAPDEDQLRASSDPEITAEELEEISAELHELSQRVVARYRAGRDRPEARPIQMNLNAFPLMFSEETP